MSSWPSTSSSTRCGPRIQANPARPGDIEELAGRLLRALTRGLLGRWLVCGWVEVKGERWGQTWLFHGTSTSTSGQGQELAGEQGQELVEEQEQGQELVEGQGLFFVVVKLWGVLVVWVVCIYRSYAKWSGAMYIQKLCAVMVDYVYTEAMQGERVYPADRVRCCIYRSYTTGAGADQVIELIEQAQVIEVVELVELVELVEHRASSIEHRAAEDGQCVARLYCIYASYAKC